MTKLYLAMIMLSLGISVSMAATDNVGVSINVNVKEVCILELNYAVGATTFEITDSKLRGLDAGNPLSYKRVSPNETNGVALTVYSNSRKGTKVEIGAADNFASKVPGVSKIIPIGQLKWTSLRGGKSNQSMGVVPTACFATSEEGIVTDNIKYALDLYSVNPFGEYETIVTYTAINNE